MMLHPTRLATLALVWLLAVEKGFGFPTSNPSTAENDFIDLTRSPYSVSGPAADDYYQLHSPGEYSMSALPHSQVGEIWGPNGDSTVISFDETSDFSDNPFLKGIMDGMPSDTDHLGHSADVFAPPGAEYSFPMDGFGGTYPNTDQAYRGHGEFGLTAPHHSTLKANVGAGEYSSRTGGQSRYPGEDIHLTTSSNQQRANPGGIVNRPWRSGSSSAALQPGTITSGVLSDGPSTTLNFNSIYSENILRTNDEKEEAHRLRIARSTCEDFSKTAFGEAAERQRTLTKAVTRLPNIAETETNSLCAELGEAACVEIKQSVTTLTKRMSDYPRSKLRKAGAFAYTFGQRVNSLFANNKKELGKPSLIYGLSYDHAAKTMRIEFFTALEGYDCEGLVNSGLTLGETPQFSSVLLPEKLELLGGSDKLRKVLQVIQTKAAIQLDQLKQRRKFS
ncbi:hypothetical protein H4R33_003548 [Dimargaris cristalligena]|nr:hypothetical protein H4R33_003548 [Dimargaris cristalligena]